MSRILHHVGKNDFKKTRQRQIGEQKERAAQKLKESQEAEAERKQIEEASRPYKSNWRRENLREFGEWAPIETSGPTNSTSTTFGYFAGGSPVINGETGQQVTFTYSGLDGVENYPTSIMIDQGGGDVMPVDPPPFSHVGVQGYTAKLNPRYAEAKKKYDEEWKEWERKKEQQQKDIEATLKSFGTSYRDIQRDGGITRVGNSYVAIVPTNTRDFGSDLLNNIRVVRLVPCDPNQPMELTKNVRDISGTKKWNVSNAQYSHDVYLQIGEQPKAPIEQEYLMPRRTDFKDVNPQLDASQEFAQKVGADEFMNARVQDPYQTKEPSLGLSQEDQEWLNDKQGLVNNLKIMQNYGGPAMDFAQWAINWAKGDYRPIKKFSPQMQNDVLDQISKTLANRSGTSGAVQYHDYGLLTNNSTRLGLGRFTFDIGPNGVRVKDNFDVDLGGAPVGGLLSMIPGLQNDANKITELGNKVGGGKGKIPIDVTIPWSQVSPELQNRLDPTATIIPIVKRRKRNRRGREVNR